MVNILDYSKEPIPAVKIVDTWRKCFNNQFNINYFNWRFLANPNEEKVFIKYIIENDTLAAYYAVSPMLLVNRYAPAIKVALANMTMTHPSYRGKGYAQRLAIELYAQLKEEEYTCVYSYPTRKVMCHIFRKHLNFQDISTLKTMHCKKEDLIRGSVVKYRYTFEQGKIDQKIIEDVQNLDVTDKNSLLLRDRKNLKWRFIDNPVTDYYYFRLLEDNKTRIVFFYKYYKQSIDIMDYYYRRTDYGREQEFLYGIENIFDKSNDPFSGINIWAESDSAEYNFLKSIGFVPAGRNTFFGIIPLNFDEESKTKGRWHNSYFDSDVY